MARLFLKIHEDRTHHIIDKSNTKAVKAYAKALCGRFRPSCLEWVAITNI